MNTGVYLIGLFLEMNMLKKQGSKAKVVRRLEDFYGDAPHDKKAVPPTSKRMKSTHVSVQQTNIVPYGEEYAADNTRTQKDKGK